MTGWKSIALNAAGFNLGWFACVLSARWGQPLAAAPIIAAILALHLFVTTPRDQRRTEVITIGTLAAIGIVVDTSLFGFGVYGFAWGAPIFALWMACFWANFAATVNTALGWLKTRLALAAALGAISAPGTYYFGEKLGSLTLMRPLWQSMTIIAIEWAILLPVCFVIARRIAASERRRESSAGAGSEPGGTPAS